MLLHCLDATWPHGSTALFGCRLLASGYAGASTSMTGCWWACTWRCLQLHRKASCPGRNGRHSCSPSKWGILCRKCQKQLVPQMACSSCALCHPARFVPPCLELSWTHCSTLCLLHLKSHIGCLLLRARLRIARARSDHLRCPGGVSFHCQRHCKMQVKPQDDGCRLSLMRCLQCQSSCKIGWQAMARAPLPYLLACRLTSRPFRSCCSSSS